MDCDTHAPHPARRAGLYSRALRARGFAIVVLLLLITRALADAPVEYAKPVKLGTLTGRGLTECSGLVLGRRNPRVLWAHNDSGDTARFFAMGLHGEDLGVWRILGLRPNDWEDIAAVKLNGVDHLVLCDVGDNDARREDCVLYVVPEPAVDLTKKGQTGDLRATGTIRFRYDDGPHNCEAVFIDPADHTIVLVTKVLLGGAGVYTLPLDFSPGVKTARRVARAAIPMATGADISPDGRRVVVITYGPAFEYHHAPGETWAKTFAGPHRVLPMPWRPQGEAIAYAADGKSLYLSSEGRSPVLWWVAGK